MAYVGLVEVGLRLSGYICFRLKVLKPHFASFSGLLDVRHPLGFQLCQGKASVAVPVDEAHLRNTS